MFTIAFKFDILFRECMSVLDRIMENGVCLFNNDIPKNTPVVNIY